MVSSPGWKAPEALMTRRRFLSFSRACSWRGRSSIWKVGGEVGGWVVERKASKTSRTASQISWKEGRGRRRGRWWRKVEETRERARSLARRGVGGWRAAA